MEHAVDDHAAVFAGDGGGGMSRIETLALAMWRLREMDFPPRVRRMNPDAIDRATGAWQMIVAAAAALQPDKQETLEL